MKKVLLLCLFNLLGFYSLAQSVIYFSDDINNIYTVDPATCEVQYICTVNGTGFLADIAYHPIDHNLYSIGMGGTLYAISLPGGTTTEIGIVPFANALTFDQDGFLYGCDQLFVYRYDVTDGSYDTVGTTTSYPAGDITFFHNKLYMTGVLASQGLEYISLDDPSASYFSSPLPLENNFGFSNLINSDGCGSNMYVFSDTNLYKLNMDDISNPTLHCPAISDRYVTGSASTAEWGDNAAFLGMDRVLCNDEPLMLTTGVEGATYLWQDNSIDPFFYAPGPGQYWVATTKDNCVSTDTITLSLNQAPEWNIDTAHAVCNGEDETVTLPEVNPDDGIVYWGFPYLSGYLYSYDPAFTFTYSNAGTYVAGRIIYGCTDVDTVKVSTFYMTPPDLGEDTTLCLGDTLLLTAPSLNDVTYGWQDNSTAQTFQAKVSDTYWVKVMHDNCVVSDTVLVYFRDCSSTLTMPNLVTINQDGLNDFFEPITSDNVTYADFMVTNRWGEQVFASQSLPIRWDASSVSEGIYYWSVEYTDAANHKLSQKGWVQIIK